MRILGRGLWGGRRRARSLSRGAGLGLRGVGWWLGGSRRRRCDRRGFGERALFNKFKEQCVIVGPGMWRVGCKATANPAAEFAEEHYACVEETVWL